MHEATCSILLIGQIRGLAILGGGAMFSVILGGSVKFCIFVKNHINPLLEFCSRDTTTLRLQEAYFCLSLSSVWRRRTIVNQENEQRLGLLPQQGKAAHPQMWCQSTPYFVGDPAWILEDRYLCIVWWVPLTCRLFLPKAVEKLADRYTREIALRNFLLHCNQHTCRNVSTETAPHNMTKRKTIAIEHNNIALGVFLNIVT
jgi:hypothetical protein